MHSGRGSQPARPISAAYQPGGPHRPIRPKTDRMQDLRNCWGRPVGKLICLGAVIFTIAAVGLIIYLTTSRRDYNDYYGQPRPDDRNSYQNRNSAYGNTNRNNPNTNPNAPSLQGLISQQRSGSGDLSEQNRLMENPNRLQQPYPNYNSQQQQQQRPSNQQPYNNPQQQPYPSYQYGSNNAQGSAVSSPSLTDLIGQGNPNTQQFPKSGDNYNQQPQIWPNAGFDPVNLLAAQQQSGATGVGMRHPESFMNNGLDQQYGRGQANPGAVGQTGGGRRK